MPPDAPPISVLVVDIVGTDQGGGPGSPGPDAARRTAADDAVNRARREIRLLGGTLDAPGTHAAVRAVRAALRVAEAVEDLEEEVPGGIAVRAAVQTGAYALADDHDPDGAE